MAGTVLKRRRLVNRGRRRLTPGQIPFFGTKRQKSALKNRRRNARRRNQGGTIAQVEHAAERAIDSIEHAAEHAIDSLTGPLGNRGRRRNVGEILTVLPANPGSRKRRRNMAATARKRNRRRNRATNRRVNRRHNRRINARRHRTRTRNPKVVVRYRTRRSNRSYRRCRNPNFLQGDAGKVVATLGGALVTSLITGMLPANFTTGWTGWLATGIVAAVTGQVAGKVFRNSTVGNWMTVGGLLIVGLQIVQQVMPQLGLPFQLAGSGTSGMGLITGSNFYVPQVNQPGSMASFYLPAAIPQAPVAVPATSMSGLGALRTFRRVGRFR